MIARLAGRNCVAAAPWGGLQDFRRGAKAFTLLELMIVLVILTIFMSIAWPRITGQIQLVAPREAALQLKSDLSEAREQAVISGEPWALRIRRGKPDYEIGPVSEFKKQQNSLSLTAPLAGVEAILQQQPTQQPGTTTSSLNVSSHNGSPVNESSSTGQLSNPPTSMSVPTERSLVESLELPDGMVFDDGFAHSTQDVNQLRFPGSQQGTNPTPLTPTLPESQTLPPTSTQSAVLGTNPVVTQPAVSNNNWKYVVIFQPDGRATESEIRLKDIASEAKIRLRIRGFTGGVTIDGVERRRPAFATDPLDPLNPEAADGLDALDSLNTAGQPTEPVGTPGLSPVANPMETPR